MTKDAYYIHNGLAWNLRPGCLFVDLGYIPSFVSAEDQRPAAQQIDENYRHGGGWLPMDGFVATDPAHPTTLTYPGDPPLRLMASTKLREETVIVYSYAWVAVFQPDGRFEISRID